MLIGCVRAEVVEQDTGAARVADEPDEPAPAPAPTPTSPSAEPAPPEPALGVADVGIFSDLDARVQLELPAQAREPGRSLALMDLGRGAGRGVLVLYVDGAPVKVYPLLDEGGVALSAAAPVRLRPGDHAELAPILTSPEQLRELAPGTPAPPGDVDDDGIPDPLDIDIGALKTTLNGARYDQSYVSLPYPGGDVPREIGACTDVIVRALRNAGIDLQAEVHEDIARAPRRYPMVETANDDIDHRRVRTILPWFRGHWIAVGDDRPPQPGDVVFMDTIARRDGPDHIGVVGHGRADNGELLVANNWTDGYTTAYMELLGYVPVTDRFRAPPAAGHRGPIPPLARQLVVVRTDGWDAFRGRARRFQRDAVGGPWRPVGESFAVVLGSAGMAWGRGLHGEGRPAGSSGPGKREGDGRSPAGVFALGDAYGRAKTADALALPYTHETASLRCVDDPGSRHYNRIVDAALDTVEQDWASAEPMRRYYELAIVVQHNLARAPEAGSCIFLHRWRDADTPVTGCTAMAPTDLDELAAWLEPGAVIAALPEPARVEVGDAWGIPRID